MSAKLVLIRGTFVEQKGEKKKVLQVFLKGTDAVGVLQRAFAAQIRGGTDADALRVVYKGAVLDADTLLADADLLPSPDRQIPHVYLCLASDAAAAEAATAAAAPSQAAASGGAGGRAGQAAAPKPPTPQAPARAPALAERQTLQEPRARVPEELDHNKCCRLCFDGEETVATGRLFSPCLCAGSMRYIHVHCLNQWRIRSGKASSYFKCDQCTYEYNIQRSVWAETLLSPRLHVVISCFYLLAATAIAGSLAASVPHVSPHERIWKLISFSPLPYFSTKVCGTDVCDALCNSYNFWNWESTCLLEGCSCTMDVTEELAWGLAAATSGLAVLSVAGLYVSRDRVFHTMTHWYCFAFSLA